MKRHGLAGLVLAVVLGGLISSASAAPYAAGDFGYVMASDATVSSPGGNGELSFDSGYGFLAAVGNSFDFVRGEIEVGYRANDMDEFTEAGISGPANGDVGSLALMANLLTDLDLSPNIKPFLGAGIGMARVELDSDTDDDDTVFAYQAIAGVGFPLTNITTLDFSYRYFATADAKLDGADIEYQTHNVFAGLRFDF